MALNTTRTIQPTGNLMLAAPLLPVTIGLLLGIVANEFHSTPILYYVFTLTIATLLSLVAKLRYHSSWLLLGIAAWSAGALLHASDSDTNAPSNISRCAADDGRIVRLRGTVISEPRQLPPPNSPFSKWQRGNWRTNFLMETTAVETTQGWESAVGRLRVSVFEPILDLEQNEAVELFGRLSTLSPPANPGTFDWSKFNRRQGVVARLTVKHRENIRRSSLQFARSTGPGWLQNALGIIRARLHQLLIDDLQQDSAAEASLLDAMVLGQRSRVDRQLNDLFIRAGCAHFLAVSGVHVAIVMLLVAFGCRLINLHPRKTTWILIVSAIAYAMIAEPRPSVWRATVMALLYCAARLLGRQRASLNWLAVSAICICIIDPNAAFNIGFQLSFVAVIGVIYLSPALISSVKDLAISLRSLFAKGDTSSMQNVSQVQGVVVLNDWRATIGTGFTYAWRIATGAASVSIGAWCATLPLVLIHFHQVHPWGAISSIVLFPLISMSMALGFAKLVMGVLSVPFSIVVNGPLGVVNSLLLWCVNGFASLPYATVTTISPPWLVVGSFYLFALSLIVRQRIINNFMVHKSRASLHSEPAKTQQAQHELIARRQKSIAGLVNLLSLALFVTVLSAWLWPTQREAELRVTFLSVGAGSATVLELSSGETLLFDAGSSGVYDIGIGTVVPYLNRRGITAIDRVYITHANLDHYSGVPSITSAINTGPIVINPYFQSHSKKSSPSAFLLKYLRKKRQLVEVLNLDHREWQIGDTSFELLWPPREPLDGLSVNNSSTVLRITYAGKSILLTGDIEQRAQRALLQAGNLQADVLALPHHGSIESTTADFIREVGAHSLIQSAGRAGNTTTERLDEMSRGAKLFSTTASGAITVVFSKDGIKVQEFSPANAALDDKNIN